MEEVNAVIMTEGRTELHTKARQTFHLVWFGVVAKRWRHFSIAIAIGNPSARRRPPFEKRQDSIPDNLIKNDDGKLHYIRVG